MRNKKMLKVVSLIALATTCIVSGAFAFNTKVANAETEGVFHELGASVRISTDKGIRFAFGLPVDKTGDGYEIGTLVIPKNVLGDAELNHNNDPADAVDVDYQPIPCTKNWVPSEELGTIAKDGYKYYNAALTDIPQAEYNTVLVARSYYLKDGVYTYSDPVERSIGYVASAALNYGEEDEESNQILTNIVIAGYGETALSVELANNLVTMDEEATLTASNEKGYLPIWSSSNEAVATVDRTGEITAVRGGETTITATIGNVSASKTVYVVGEGLYQDQIGARICGNDVSGQSQWISKETSENGATVITAKFQADATYSPALILRNMYSKAYYEKLIANGYTKLAFNLAVEGDVTDLYVLGKLVSTLPVKDGVYSFAIDVQHIVNHYDTMKTIATSGNKAGQASSLAAKLISWKSPAGDYKSIRNYVFTISNAAYVPEVTLEVTADKTEIAYGETATLTATTNRPESEIVWSTSDATIATVENGVVTVTGENWGEVTITATVEDVSVDTIITVNAPTQLEIAFAAESKDVITVNGTTALIATTDWNASKIAWSSSNNEVATVENGVVTGVKGGEATITATLNGLTASKTIYVVGDGLYSDQIGARINGWNQSSVAEYCGIQVGENGEITVSSKFQASATFSPALILRNMYSKAYYEKLIANGYTKLAFNLAVEGEVTDLHVLGKLVSTLPVKDGVYSFAIDVQHIVNHYDTMKTIATSGNQVGQASSLAAKLISWNSPAGDYTSVRNYVFTISNAAFMSTPTLDVVADTTEIAYGETATLNATTDWDESFVAWSTSDASIATVENGVVTVTGENWGEVTITATIAGVRVDTIITVNAPTQLEIAFAAESKAVITVNGTTTLEATTDWNASKIAWSSSNNKVATVENGVVMGLKAGEATITATLGDLTASKTVYVVGEGLYQDQIGMRIGGYQYHDKPAYFNMATGENGAMIITAKFSDSELYYPMLMLRNMYSKAYYQALVSNGYTKLAFNLAVEGDISDLYVFGKALNTFPENEGIYAIAVDVQHIATYYDNIYGIATSGGQAGQAGSLDKMLIAWKSPLKWAGSRNYVFTISNAAFMSTPTLDVVADEMEIAYGETATLNATTDWDESFVAWSTSDASIATVENGVVTVTGENWGEVTITATIAGVSVDTIITVNAPTQLEIAFAAESKDAITVNGTTTLEATTDWNASKIAWSSSNNKVATVENGVVMGLKAGEATITATLNGLTASKTIYVVGDGLYSDQIGARINGWNQSSVADYCGIQVGENGEITVSSKFQASATYSPALILRNMYSKAYYEKLIANGYTKLAFNLAVEGEVTDLYVLGKLVSTLPVKDGVYSFAIDVQHIVNHYDTMKTIATSGSQVGQASSLAAKLISWKSPTNDWSTVRNYVFTISNAAFMSTPTLDVVADEMEIAYGETATLNATTDWDESFVAWSTSDATIATVENGVVTVTGENWGEVTITATIAGVSVGTIITVNAPTQLEVEFAAESKDIITVNGTTTLEATTDWNVDRVAWTSSNNEVATVENGVVTGVKGGEVTITATLGDLTASKTVYVVGNTLDTDSFAVIAGAWNQPTFVTTTTGANDEMVITAQFKGDQWRWPAVVLRNLESKAYYEKLIAEGYKKLTFSLAVGGANASNVSDLYVFGKALSTFAKNASGAYQIVVDVQNIVNNYDTIGILGTGVEAVPSNYHDQMLISWKCTASNASTTRNYVFTISNTGFRQGVLFSDDFGFRNGGENETYDEMKVDTGANGEIIIDATFNATASFGSFLMFNKMDTITYLGGLKGKYASFTFELTVEGGAVNDLHTFGTAKAISTCNKVSGKDNTYVVEIRLDLTYFTASGWKDNMTTFATSTGKAGSWEARSQMLLAWRYNGSNGFTNPGNHAPRNYKFTIANFELRESLLYSY